MSFTSMAYLIFVLIGVILYYIIPKKIQWLLLLSFSIIFYLIAGPFLILFLLTTAFSTFISGLFIEKSVTVSKKKLIIVLCLLLNFGILFFLKYYNFSVDIVSKIFNFESRFIDFALPLGISFYTFQSVSYLIDVYWERTATEHNFARFLLFVSFFPQILQGPIGRYSKLSPQFFAPHFFDIERIGNGLVRIFWGYFQKFVLADRAGILVNQVVSNYQEYDGTIIVLAILMYSIQLYGDFAGGMDVVIGTAELFDIELDENFRQPYFAVSIADFWHRWHITLGTWMKDYVFYALSLSKPFRKLGGKTRKKFGRRTGIAIPVALCNIIVFLIVGVWHGAGGKYLIYGLLNGLIIALAELLGDKNKQLLKKIGLSIESSGIRVYRIILTFVLVNFSWYFDVATDLKCSFGMLRNTVCDFNISTIIDGSALRLGLSSKDMIALTIGCITLFVVSLIKEKGCNIRKKIYGLPIVFRWGIYLALFFSVAILGKYTNGGFIYAQF